MLKTETVEMEVLRIAADLDARTVVAAYEMLAKSLENRKKSGKLSRIEFDASETPPSPLSLQLLVSATRTVPRERLDIGTRATAVLANLELLKENQ
ncbi:hypothetical protein JSE7799_02545 [Jannaschia seosinensis]|uniref:Uncharacterized protein n=1 Tax=Jannaschia seosinensis TaxID=313367 RepID=A0A0M7BAK1_9RHOB|nr:hypothetical protein [Jannaschia seosinensis]CUH39817.1 hypothetical protein JSE7799_02545 [Jannaschia seosinensis]